MLNSSNIFNYKARKKILSFANQRGILNIGLHGLRRIGTLMHKALVGPCQIRLNPFSYICNHKCFMCNLQNLSLEDLRNLKQLDYREALALQDYKAILMNHQSGLISINITGGGEPLLHPDIIDIMGEVKKHDIKGSLITNGTRLNQKFSQQIIDMKWDGIRISIHAGDPETYQNVSGVDKFQELIENLIFFNEYRQRRSSNSTCQLILFNVIQRENIAAIEKIFETAEKIGADHIEFERLIPFDRKFKLTMHELASARDKLTGCAKISGISCNLESILKQIQTEISDIQGTQSFRPAKRCSVGFDQVFITAQGDVYPCCFSNEKMGNVRNQSLKSIWNNALFAEFRQRLISGQFANYCYENRCALPGVLHNW